jgi:hypothetical protein
MYKVTPSYDMTPTQKINSQIRLVLYSSAILYALTRETTIIYVGLIVTSLLLLSEKDGYTPNPVGNPPLDKQLQYQGEPSTQAQADELYPFIDQNVALRNFHKVPTFDQGAFIKGMYPHMLGPMCKDDPSVCSPGKF